MPHHSVIVQVGGFARAVTYSIVERHPGPFLFIRFKGPDGRRLEKTTKVCTARRVHEVAAGIVQKAHEEPGDERRTPWDAALPALVGAMRASNLRPGSVENYLGAIRQVREAFPGLHSPSDLTPNLAKQ